MVRVAQESDIKHELLLHELVSVLRLSRLVSIVGKKSTNLLRRIDGDALLRSRCGGIEVDTLLELRLIPLMQQIVFLLRTSNVLKIITLCTP